MAFHKLYNQHVFITPSCTLDHRDRGFNYFLEMLEFYQQLAFTPVKDFSASTVRISRYL